MDDLLALMGGSMDDIHQDSQSGNEEAFEVERIVCQTSSSSSYDPSTSQSSFAKAKTSSYSPNFDQRSATKKAAGSIDPLTKIRIVARQTSKVDLVDYLAPFQFHTAALLASMSKASLSSFITHPSKNGDECSGRTSMATMGIVLSNSGTRMSKNGRAFSILTIGDLHTGPTVSIFMFGHAYSMFTTKIQTGSVIAVLGSNLMPSNGKNNETRISLSVNEQQQIILVGKAMDYGMCTAVDYRKQSGGEKIQVRCKHYVDTRLGKMCKFHQKQQRQRQNHQGPSKRQAVAGGRNSNLSFVQSMKQERSLRAGAYAQASSLPSNAMTLVMPGQGTVVTHIPGGSGASNVSSRGGLGVSSSLQQAMESSDLAQNLSSTQKYLQRAPKHMQISNATNSTSPRSILSTNTMRKTSVKNPYAKPTPTTSVSMRNSRNISNASKLNGSKDLLGEVLNKKSDSMNGSKQPSSHHRANSATASRRKKLVPQYMDGFDGQVSVPKPNTLFRKAAVPRNHHTMSTMSTNGLSSQEKIDSIRQKQIQLARQLRQNRSKISVASSSSTVMKRLNKVNASKNKRPTHSSIDELLGTTPMTKEDKHSVLEAKSKYTNEANAELYAKSRQVLNELEKQEGARDKRTNKRNNGKTGTTGSNDTKVLISEWTCLTCNKKRMHSKPILCIRANHNVKRVRDIKKSKNVTERRLNLKNKSSDEGGLVLGAGLEWSGWKHNC